MTLEFKCPSCDEDITVRYLNVGDLVECQNCREHVVIPEDAVSPSDSEDEALSEDTLDPSNTDDIDDAVAAPPGRASKVFTVFVLLLAIGFIVYVSIYAFMRFFSESSEDCQLDS